MADYDDQNPPETRWGNGEPADKPVDNPASAPGWRDQSMPALEKQPSFVARLLERGDKQADGAESPAPAPAPEQEIEPAGAPCPSGDLDRDLSAEELMMPLMGKVEKPAEPEPAAAVPAPPPAVAQDGGDDDDDCPCPDDKPSGLTERAADLRACLAERGQARDLRVVAPPLPEPPPPPPRPPRPRGRVAVVRRGVLPGITMRRGGCP